METVRGNLLDSLVDDLNNYNKVQLIKVGLYQYSYPLFKNYLYKTFRHCMSAWKEMISRTGASHRLDNLC